MIFEYYETEHLQTLLKLDFYKGLEAGHLIRKCELCGRLFLLQKDSHTKYCDSPNPDNPVSYTHLDVYKRQFLSRINEAEVGLRPRLPSESTKKVGANDYAGYYRYRR